MKKYCMLFFIAIFLFLPACGQAEQFICDICGVNHQAAFEDGVAGASSRHNFFNVFSADPYSNEFLRIYVESCWAGSIQPEFRLNFVTRYDVAELYNTISIAESNVPFEAIFNNETIKLRTDILGLEEIFITLNEQQQDVGFAYTIRRGIEQSPSEHTPTNEKMICGYPFFFGFGGGLFCADQVDCAVCKHGDINEIGEFTWRGVEAGYFFLNIPFVF